MTVDSRWGTDRQRCREAASGGIQVLQGWIGRAFEDGAAGVRAVAEG